MAKRGKCVAGDKCEKNIRSKQGVKKVYRSGANLSRATGIPCPAAGCNKLCCIDSAVCLCALKAHIQAAHGEERPEFTAAEFHAIAHALVAHFGVGGGVDVARRNHAKIAALKDGLDPVGVGNSDRFNRWCSTCGVNLGAYAFVDGPDPATAELHCYTCTLDRDPSTTLDSALRLWSDRAMRQSWMWMALQHDQRPLREMHEDIPSVRAGAAYKGKTHMSAAAVKASWVARDTKDWDGKDADTAFDIAADEDRTTYLSVNLSQFSRVSRFFAIRRAFPADLLAWARGVADIGYATLVILGGTGTGTGFHHDWTEAYNFALSVGKVVPAGTILAVWTLINPLLVRDANGWILERRIAADDQAAEGEPKWPLGFGSPPDQRVHLKDDELDAFVDFLKGQGLAQRIENPVLQIEQTAGQLVYVPAGWVHQVTNFSPNVKVAWDCYTPGNFHKYSQLQHRIASSIFKQGMARDYMSSNMVLQDLASR